MVVATTTTGQTLGKRLLQTRVVDASTGEPPRLGPAVLRWAVLVGPSLVGAILPGPNLSALVLIVVAPILFDRYHQGLHDRAAGTVVTRLR